MAAPRTTAVKLVETELVLVLSFTEPCMDKGNEIDLRLFCLLHLDIILANLLEGCGERLNEVLRLCESTH